MYGGEATMWEEIASAENIDVKLWPRLAVIAERLWSPENVTDVDSMYFRLEVTSRWLESLNIRPRYVLSFMRQRLAGTSPAGPLDTFASVLEPVREYTRHEDKTHSYGINTPLNRLVDSIAPESDAAREFRNAVDRYLASSPSAKEEGPALEMSLRRWSTNTAQLLPLLVGNGILSETVPLALSLDEVCKAGLEALASLRGGKTAKSDWTKKRIAVLDEADKSQADMFIRIAPGVRKLVEAAGR